MGLHFLRKLTLVDYLIIAVVLLAAIILFRFFNPEEKWINMVVFVQNVPIFQADALEAGDIEKGPRGEKIAEIVEVRRYDTPQTPIANKDIFLTIRVLSKINPQNKEFEFKNKVIKVGTPVEFRFTRGFVLGKVAQIEGALEKRETRILTLKLYNQWPWLADSLKIGEGEIGKNGEKIVEILSKITSPAQFAAITSKEETFLRTDIEQVDITFKIKVQVEEVEGELIFKGMQRILIGELISFNADKTRVKDALITDIE